jgi:hypothetical protein
VGALLAALVASVLLAALLLVLAALDVVPWGL